MKAKEYAARYLENPISEELVKVATDMIGEVKTLADARHTTSNAALVSIQNEVVQKWKAFVRIVGDENIKDNGLDELIKKYFPEAHIAWEISRQAIEQKRIHR